MKPNALFIAMTALALLLSILACGSSGPPVITDAVTAKRLDENSKPVDQTSNYLPEDVICISVYVENMVIGSSVKVEYKYNGELYEKSELTADQA